MAVQLLDGAIWFGAFVISTSCHEAAHAWAALQLGDDTASRGGQVSLNPLPHLRREPIGMVVMPILSWLMGGWMMGWASAPFSPEWARQFPRRAAWMALAGPAANLALAGAMALLMRVGVEWGVFVAPYSLNMTHLVSAASADPTVVVLAKVVSVGLSLNLLLCVFNLLPVPPLDGSSVPMLLLPETAARRYLEVLHSPMLRLVGLLFLFRGFGSFFPPILAFVASLLHPGSHYG
jgi:Zn-dependent protease